MKSKKQTHRSIITRLSVLALAAALPLTAQTVLLDNNFDSSTATGWFASTGDALDASSGDLAWSTDSLAIAHFQAATLEVGESITLSANFKITSGSANGSSNAIRFGLFNTMGTKTSANGQDASAGQRNDDKGYFTTLNTGAYQGAGALLFRSQTQGNDITTPIDSAPKNELVPNYPFLSGRPDANTTNSFEFRITLLDENTLQLWLTITGDNNDPAAIKDARVVSVISSDPSFTKTFDEVALAFWDGAKGSFDDIKVVYSGDLAPIPEPYSLGFGFGIIALTGALFYRRCRR